MATPTPPESLSFDDFMSQAWAAHAREPEAVAARLADPGVQLAATPACLGRLAALTNHVHGTHLGAWDAGTQALQSLLDHPQCTGTARPEVMRALASLALCRGDAGDMDETLSPSDCIRATATAASHLAERDTPRAIALWQDALARYQDLQPAADDPCQRALAVAGNNLAFTLEELPERTEAQRHLMVQAAQAGRKHWELAGTWKEVAWAEYRLAMTWLKAENAAQALTHAQAFQDLVVAKDAPVLEQFFAAESLALCARSLGDEAGWAEARARAERTYVSLDESDREWCRPSLEALRS